MPVPDPDVEHERERIVLEGDAKPREPPFRLPFPYPLPLCDGRLRPGRPRVRDVGNEHWVLACHCIP